MEDQKGLSLDNTLLLFILINGENQLECSPLGEPDKSLSSSRETGQAKA
jgi:hypothetical protein